MRFFLLLLLPFSVLAQNYTSYRIGSASDTAVQPLQGICLMGGATENDEAMKWFLQRAAGGDVLVLRASGSDGYNNYFYNQLGVNLHSVETIVCHNANSATATYIHQRIQEAEAIWLAGGDQWDYVSYWRGTDIDGLIHEGIQQRGLVMGGTSAGMAVQGGIYFSAQNGTVTSATALNNPYDNAVQIDSTSFLRNGLLKEVITDTHYDNPDRRGRQVVFLARAMQDLGITAKGIACEEYTAVCIDENGRAFVYGGYPNYNDYAYFIQSNCSLQNPLPDSCIAGQALHWDKNGQALKVYKVPGTMQGNTYFDLGDWQTAFGGNWEDWSVQNGSLTTVAGNSPNCTPVGVMLDAAASFEIYPNPIFNDFNINGLQNIQHLQLFDLKGHLVKQWNGRQPSYAVDQLTIGLYLLQIQTAQQVHVKKLVIKRE